MISDHDRRDWEEGWAGHEAQQLERLSRLPLSERLRWLEEAHRLVLHLSGASSSPATLAVDERTKSSETR